MRMTLLYPSTAKSSFGWELVSFMEADLDLHKEVHGLDIEELRAQERRMMQHNRCVMHPMLGTHLMCLLQAVGCRHSCAGGHRGHGGVG